MNWFATIIVYYVLVYLLLGGILVDLLSLTTWPTMIGMFLGCCTGHYLGKIELGGNLGTKQ